MLLLEGLLFMAALVYFVTSLFSAGMYLDGFLTPKESAIGLLWLPLFLVHALLVRFPRFVVAVAPHIWGIFYGSLVYGSPAHKDSPHA